MRTAIVTDAGCGLDAREAAALGVVVVPQRQAGAFLVAYRAAGAEQVLVLTSALDSYAAATDAAGLADLPVDVVDSGTSGGGLRLVLRELTDLLAAGEAYEEVLALAGSFGPRVRATWGPDAEQAERVLADTARSPSRVAVGHAGDPELAARLVEQLAGRPGVLGVETYAVDVPPGVGAHWLAAAPEVP